MGRQHIAYFPPSTLSLKVRTSILCYLVETADSDIWLHVRLFLSVGGARVEGNSVDGRGSCGLEGVVGSAWLAPWPERSKGRFFYWHPLPSCSFTPVHQSPLLDSPSAVPSTCRWLTHHAQHSSHARTPPLTFRASLLDVSSRHTGRPAVSYPVASVSIYIKPLMRTGPEEQSQAPGCYITNPYLNCAAFSPLWCFNDYCFSLMT